jgi:hypothetical protein
LLLSTIAPDCTKGVAVAGPLPNRKFESLYRRRRQTQSSSFKDLLLRANCERELVCVCDSDHINIGHIAIERAPDWHSCTSVRNQLFFDLPRRAPLAESTVNWESIKGLGADERSGAPTVTFVSLMHFALLATLLSFASFAVAHITGITGPATYHPTAHSNYPLTFITENGPITKYALSLFFYRGDIERVSYSEDFSVAVGLGNAAQPPSGAALGTFIHNFDLENTGHGSSVPIPVILSLGNFGLMSVAILSARKLHSAGSASLGPLKWPRELHYNYSSDQCYWSEYDLFIFDISSISVLTPISLGGLECPAFVLQNELHCQLKQLWRTMTIKPFVSCSRTSGFECTLSLCTFLESIA